MKVFVVSWAYKYEEDIVLGVYTTNELAQNEIVRHSEGRVGTDDYYIREFELDQ